MADVPPVQGIRCPTCTKANAPDRRFCGRCGAILGNTQNATRSHVRTGAGPTPPGRVRARQERLARKAYRRSLPAFYRWRRLVLGLLAVLAVGGLVAVLSGDPVQRIRDLWTTATGSYVTVTDVAAEGSAALPYDAKSAVDGDPVTAWAVPWTAGAAEPPCGGGGSGALVLSWEAAAEVRRIEVRAGLDGDKRPYQYLPRRIDVQVDGQCRMVSLSRTGDWQERPLELDGQITTVAITVATVYANQAEPVDPHVAISEVRLLAAPS